MRTSRFTLGLPDVDKKRGGIFGRTSLTSLQQSSALTRGIQRSTEAPRDFSRSFFLSPLICSTPWVERAIRRLHWTLCMVPRNFQWEKCTRVLCVKERANIV